MYAYVIMYGFFNSFIGTRAVGPGYADSATMVYQDRENAEATVQRYNDMNAMTDVFDSNDELVYGVSKYWYVKELMIVDFAFQD